MKNTEMKPHFLMNEKSWVVFRKIISENNQRTPPNWVMMVSKVIMNSCAVRLMRSLIQIFE